MNSTLSVEQLKQLKGIMQSMLAQANNANWQELSRLDSERRVLIGYNERTTSTRNALLGNAVESGKSPATGLQAESESAAQQEVQTIPLAESGTTGATNPIRKAPTREYANLSAEIISLDKQITSTVVNARQALLDQTRVLRAQVSAKKGYENANTMKISSYS